MSEAQLMADFKAWITPQLGSGFGYTEEAPFYQKRIDGLILGKRLVIAIEGKLIMWGHCAHQLDESRFIADYGYAVMAHCPRVGMERFAASGHGVILPILPYTGQFYVALPARRSRATWPQFRAHHMGKWGAQAVSGEEVE
jgi:hypothetical protein